jgi:hypothetical protein
LIDYFLNKYLYGNLENNVINYLLRSVWFDWLKINPSILVSFSS